MDNTLKIIKKYMNKRNLQQQDMAKLLNISVSHMSKIMNEHQKPGPKIIQAYYNLPGIKEQKIINKTKDLVNTLWINNKIDEEIAKKMINILMGNNKTLENHENLNNSVNGGLEMSFGENLRQLRERNGLSQGDMAKDMGLGKSTISLWENNTRVPSFKLIKELKNYLGVSYDVLLSNEENNNKIDLKKVLNKENIYFGDEKIDTNAIKALLMFLKYYRKKENDKLSLF